LELAIYIGLLLLDVGGSVDGGRHVDGEVVGILGILGITDEKKGKGRKVLLSGISQTDRQ